MRDLADMDVRDERNTLGTLHNVLNSVINLKVLSEEDLCRKFKISPKGLEMWMGVGVKEHFMADIFMISIYESILEEVEALSAA